MPEINTFVFDLGGVLIDWNPDYVYCDFFDNRDDMQWFYDNICTSEWNEQQDAGRSLAEGTEMLVRRFPEHEKLIRVFYDRWEDMLGGPISESVEILRHLKSKYSIYALTNWSTETFPVALDKFDFLHWFDGIVVSGEEKTRKPLPEIYQRLIERFGIKPENSVFVDDKEYNLPPAKRLGFKTIHFKSPSQFKSALNQMEIPF